MLFMVMDDFNPIIAHFELPYFKYGIWSNSYKVIKIINTQDY